MVMPDGTWPNPLDGAVLDAMLSVRTDALTVAVRAVTFVGNTLSLIVIGVVGVLWLLSRGHRSWAGYCGVTALLAWALMGLAKLVFGRQRPPIPPRLVEIDSLSFPSGHALNSMVVFGVFAVAACALTGRRWPIVAAAVASAAIGMSRVYLAAHWMTDVLAGWAIGALIVAIGLWLRPRATHALTRGRAAPLDRPGEPPGAAP